MKGLTIKVFTPLLQFIRILINILQRLLQKMPESFEVNGNINILDCCTHKNLVNKYHLKNEGLTSEP